MNVLMQALISSAVAILTALVGILSAKVMAYLDKKGIIAELESKMDIVNTVVNAMEQIWKQGNGNVKLENAQRMVLKLLDEKGIKISDEELEMLIEDAVKNMNDAYHDEQESKKEVI